MTQHQTPQAARKPNVGGTNYYFTFIFELVNRELTLLHFAIDVTDGVVGRVASFPSNCRGCNSIQL